MKNLFYVLLLLMSGVVQAQTPFWTEDFAGGIPAGWTTADASGQNAIWTWCNDPANDGADPGCPLVWDDALNEQGAFAATTATNGFMTLDSDEYGELANDHISELTTTAFDFTGKNKVFLQFEAHLGTYTYNADDKAVIRVSTDLTNWTTYQVFYGLTTSERWSDNPYTAIVDITATAANNPVVYIQWQWTGNYEYFWNIDDIGLYNINPTPTNDVALGDIFFPLSSYATPVSEIQTDTCAFYAYVSNIGLNDQHNIKLKAWVTDSNNALLYADSTSIETLVSGYQDSIIILPNLYAPEVEEGLYTIHYEVSSDSLDARVVNNLRTTEFAATTTTFAKEDGPEQFVRPAADIITDPWYVGNYYRFSKKSLENFMAVSIDFAHTVDEAEVPINTVAAGVYLLRVKDEIDDNLDNLINTDFFASFDWVGLGDYIAADTAVDDNSIRTVELLDLAAGTPGVALETGGRYFAAVSYAGDSKNVYQGFNDDNKYFFTSTLLYGGTSFYTFGPDANAVVRLNMALVTTTDEIALPDDAMEVYPNPATDRINVDLNLAEAGPVTVTIADLTGRVVMTDNYDQLQKDVLSLKLPKVAPGVYLARIATEKGTLTKRFTVVK